MIKYIIFLISFILLLFVISYFYTDFFNNKKPLNTTKPKNNKNNKTKIDIETEENEQEKEISLKLTNYSRDDIKYTISINTPNEFIVEKDKVVGKKYTININDNILEYKVNEINCEDNTYTISVHYDNDEFDNVDMNNIKMNIDNSINIL